MFKTLRIALGVYLSLSMSAAAFAQVPGADDPDSKELAAYRLTLPTLAKVLQATRSMAEAAKNDPRFRKQAAIEAEIEKLEAKEELTEADETRLEQLRAEAEQMEKTLDLTDDTQTLAEMAAAVEKEPLVAKALAQAGISAREYAKFFFAYLSAGMVAGMMEQGLIKEVPKDLAATINMENVKFFQQNKAELEAFGKAMEELK